MASLAPPRDLLGSWSSEEEGTPPPRRGARPPQGAGRGVGVVPPAARIPNEEIDLDNL